MALQFRRRKSFGPLRFSLSQRGLSTSVGAGPFRLLYGADGKVRRTVRIPGAGIWDTRVIHSFLPPAPPPRGRAGLPLLLVELALYVALLAAIVAILVTG